MLKQRCQMPWSGNPEILISQYDVRVHLDQIPDYSKQPKPQLTAAQYAEEAKCNYERYRNLVINLFQEVSEEDYLKRIAMEEMYPTHSTAGPIKDKSAGSSSKAAIGYSYGEEVVGDYNASDNDSEQEEPVHAVEVAQLNADDLMTTEIDKLNLCALEFKISAGYFGRMLHEEKSFYSQQQHARQMVAETRRLHGKHAKRERRLLRESRRFNQVQTTPPSYAQRNSPTYEPYENNNRSRSRSKSRSSSPEVVQSIVEYITEFGAASDDEGSSSKRVTTAQPHKSSTSSSHKHTSSSNSRQHKRSHSRSHSRERHHRHYRSRSRSAERRRHRSRSSSSSERHHHRKSYPRSYSRSEASHSRSHQSSRSRTRSMSPVHHISRSPAHRRSRSPVHRRSRSPAHHRSRSPTHRRLRSPAHRRSRSPIHHKSKSPGHRRSRSPGHRRSRSPGHHRSRSPVHHRSRSPSQYKSKYHRERSSSSSDGSSEERRPVRTPVADKKESIVKKTTGSKPKLTPQERLQKKLQLQLNKQLKQDKKTQKVKASIKAVEQMEREDDLREQARKWRSRDSDNYYRD
ncbi:CLK4-associating serine/arginine rich protein-like isoform X2 [Dysidea avara]|uniref:CLK4-associating serine/arginine rich protein-like isoform X2 n=1 Tax=Dysidea avara TaxID=196820 RepID=UPI00331BF28E